MKSRAELEQLIQQIASADSPVGMDAVYVHALILDKLEHLDRRLSALEASQAASATQAASPPDEGSS